MTTTPITPVTLASFHGWLRARGRADGTAELYVKNVRSCAATAGLTERLVAGDLAPLSRRTNKAALAAWAKFSKDPELGAMLEDIRLPPARRVGTKLPLAPEDWKRLANHLKTCRVPHESLRHVALIIVRRGLRVSDALRIRRSEVTAALASGILSFEGKGAKRHEFSAAPVRAQLEGLAEHRGWDRVRDLVSRDSKAATAPNRVRRVINRAGAALKLTDVYPHRFRRTYATNFLEQLAGDPRALIKLQSHMGWASLQTAAGYADAVDRDELAKVGDVLVAGALD